MNSPKKTYGTYRGRDITDGDLDRIVQEAEVGYDVETLERSGSLVAESRSNWSGRNGPDVDSLYASAG